MGSWDHFSRFALFLIVIACVKFIFKCKLLESQLRVEFSNLAK